MRPKRIYDIQQVTTITRTGVALFDGTGLCLFLFLFSTAAYSLF